MSIDAKINTGPRFGLLRFFAHFAANVVFSSCKEGGGEVR